MSGFDHASSTGRMLKSDADSLPPRPGSAYSGGAIRPGTSSGRRNLAQMGSTSNQGPDLAASTTDVLRSELGQDELLRIMSSQRLQFENDALQCAERGDLKGLAEAIANGVDIISCRGLHGYNLLHHACNRGHALIVSELLRLKLPIDSRNDMDEAPLHLAVYAGNILIVDQLLDKGADVNARNIDKETPLFYAARRNQPAIIRLLLQRGAQAELEDDLGDKAIDQATEANCIKAFDTKLLGNGDNGGCGDDTHSSVSSNNNNRNNLANAALQYSVLLNVYSYLNVMDVLRCACVSTKWHRVSEYEEVWQRLGVRRWELALQSSLGFAPAPTTSFYRPSRSASGKVSSRENSSRNLLGSDAANEYNSKNVSQKLGSASAKGSNSNSRGSNSSSSRGSAGSR